MKENPNIDELLNSFIDTELSARQVTEVQRLIDHDERIALRLRQLQKCKMLVGSLPRAEAPAEMLEDIKTTLERRTLLGEPAVAGERFDEREREGVRSLLVRRLLAVAAMIGLVAVLGTVVYTILSPESVTKTPMAIETGQQPGTEVEIEKAIPSVVATVSTGFSGRLELKTNALIAVDAFINRAIEDNGLLEYIGPRSRDDKGVYALTCNRAGLSLLLADLENVWARFDSATLFVEAADAAGEIVVEAVTPEQIAEIANQDSLERRIAMAKDFAVLNNMAEALPGRAILAAIDNNKGEDLITIPKPVLTTGEKRIKKPASGTERQGRLYLTIVVVGSE